MRQKASAILRVALGAFNIRHPYAGRGRFLVWKIFIKTIVDGGNNLLKDRFPAVIEKECEALDYFSKATGKRTGWHYRLRSSAPAHLPEGWGRHGVHPAPARPTQLC